MRSTDQASSRRSAPSRSSSSSGSALARPPDGSVLPDGRLRFENFVVGSANRLAVAAARAVAEAPGSVYNPLVVYSGSGLGKTHLLAAVGNLARQLNPSLVVEYTPLDELVEQLHAAVSAGEADALRKRYQEAELFLLDDVQF